MSLDPTAMKEVERQVRVVSVHARCPDCGEATLELFNGVMLASSPPQYPHRCTSCGATHYIRGTHYPALRYIPVAETGQD